MSQQTEQLVTTTDSNSPIPTAEPKVKDATDWFIEEYGDAWPLEMVRFAHDDGGRVIEIFIQHARADGLRLAVPHRYNGFSTIVISVDEGWGAN